MKTRQRIFALLLAVTLALSLLPVPGLAAGDTGTILVEIVLDNDPSQPIPSGISLLLSDESYVPIQGVPYATPAKLSNRLFQFSGVPAGVYMIRVSRDGYSTQNTRVELAAGATETRLMNLNPPLGTRYQMTPTAENKLTMAPMPGCEGNVAEISQDDTGTTIRFIQGTNQTNTMYVTEEDVGFFSGTLEFDVTYRQGSADNSTGFAILLQVTGQQRIQVHERGDGGWGITCYDDQGRYSYGAHDLSMTHCSRGLKRHFKLQITDGTQISLWVNGVPVYDRVELSTLTAPDPAFSFTPAKGGIGFAGMGGAAGENFTIKDLFIYREDTKYAVAPYLSEAGSVFVAGSAGTDPAAVCAKDTVTLEVRPSAGYQVKTVTVDGVDIQPQPDGTYSFVMPEKDVALWAEFERTTYHVPLYGTAVIPAAQAAAAKAALTGADQVAVRDNPDGSLTVVGLHLTSQPIALGGAGWWLDVVGEAAAPVPVGVRVDGSEVRDVSGLHAAVDYISDESKVDAQVVAGGRRWVSSDGDYTGATEDLSGALYTLTAVPGGYTAVNGDICLWVHSNNGYPGRLVTAEDPAATVEFREVGDGTFYILGLGGAAYLAFDPAGKHFVDRAAGTPFTLYRPAREGETAEAGLPGYLRVTRLADMEDGGQYLITAEGSDGSRCALYPSTDPSSRSAHVIQMGAEALRFLGKDVTRAAVRVIAGGSAYDVTVSPAEGPIVGNRSIRVTVTDGARPVEGAAVLLEDLSYVAVERPGLGGGYYEQRTGADGVAVLEMGAVTDGYHVRVSAPGYETQTREVSVTSTSGGSVVVPVQVTLPRIDNAACLCYYDFSDAAHTPNFNTTVKKLVSAAGSNVRPVAAAPNTMDIEIRHQEINSMLVFAGAEMRNGVMEFDVTRPENESGPWGMALRAKDGTNMVLLNQNEDGSWVWKYWKSGLSGGHTAAHPVAAGPALRPGETRHVKVKMEGTAVSLWVDGVVVMENVELTVGADSPYAGVGYFGFGGAGDYNLTVSNLYLTRLDTVHTVMVKPNDNGRISIGGLGAITHIAQAYAGDTVTVETAPNDGYYVGGVEFHELDSSGVDLGVLPHQEGEHPNDLFHAFTMPANNVRIETTFTQSPTVWADVDDKPTNLTVRPGYAQIALEWTPPEAAARGGVYYNVYRNGEWLAKTWRPYYVDGGLSQGVGYSYTVEAAYSESAKSQMTNSVSNETLTGLEAFLENAVVYVNLTDPADPHYRAGKGIAFTGEDPVVLADRETGVNPRLLDTLDALTEGTVVAVARNGLDDRKPAGWKTGNGRAVLALNDDRGEASDNGKGLYRGLQPYFWLGKQRSDENAFFAWEDPMCRSSFLWSGETDCMTDGEWHAMGLSATHVYDGDRQVFAYNPAYDGLMDADSTMAVDVSFLSLRGGAERLTLGGYTWHNPNNEYDNGGWVGDIAWAAISGEVLSKEDVREITAPRQLTLQGPNDVNNVATPAEFSAGQERYPFGAVVTLTPNPGAAFATHAPDATEENDPDYRAVTVMDARTRELVAVSRNGDGTYSFVMPFDPVIVTGVMQQNLSLSVPLYGRVDITPLTALQAALQNVSLPQVVMTRGGDGRTYLVGLAPTVERLLVPVQADGQEYIYEINVAGTAGATPVQVEQGADWKITVSGDTTLDYVAVGHGDIAAQLYSVGNLATGTEDPFTGSPVPLYTAKFVLERAGEGRYALHNETYGVYLAEKSGAPDVYAPFDTDLAALQLEFDPADANHPGAFYIRRPTLGGYIAIGNDLGLNAVAGSGDERAELPHRVPGARLFPLRHLPRQPGH